MESSSNAQPEQDTAPTQQSATNQQDLATNPTTSQNETPLPLPAPGTESHPDQIDMSSGSGSIKMDHLGPLVVNADGTLSRIGNWEGMTERERENTLRILGKRNQARLRSLREGEGMNLGGEGKEGR